MKLKRYPLKKHIDNRGMLIQNDYKFISKKMKHFLLSFSKPGAVRGNHYHKKKREWFFVIQGRIKLYLMDLKTKKRREYIIDSKKPELFEMEPNIVHAMKNISNDELIFLGIVNKPFDNKNPDTYFYKLI